MLVVNDRIKVENDLTKKSIIDTFKRELISVKNISKKTIEKVDRFIIEDH